MWPKYKWRVAQKMFQIIRKEFCRKENIIIVKMKHCLVRSWAYKIPIFFYAQAIIALQCQRNSENSSTGQCHEIFQPWVFSIKTSTLGPYNRGIKPLRRQIRSRAEIRKVRVVCKTALLCKKKISGIDDTICMRIVLFKQLLKYMRGTVTQHLCACDVIDTNARK
jgi:hypothetical protein